MADISLEVEAIEVASRGEEVRQPIVDALEKLNTNLLPKVAATDAGKVLAVSSAGEWEASENEYTIQVDWSEVGNKPTTTDGYGIEELEAEKITGMLPASSIPPSALERLKVVADDTARFVLTTNEVQNGDTVKVESTGLMYLVKDQDKLSTEDGYEVYKAGTASAVDWSGIQNKPTTLSGYGITDGVQAVSGKGLSTNDYTSADKSKVDALGEASKKGVVTTVDNSANLPTSAAVKAYVDDLGLSVVDGKLCITYS